MLSRIRVTIVLALLLALIPSITALAKGGFSFITVTGPNLEDTVRASDPALTEDFFAFADFYRNETEAPANPGTDYEITRYQVDHFVTGQREITYVAGGREVAFDRLHYYPDTGFVYYDGILNGSSEYDGKWYTAQPGIEVVFKKAISNHLQIAPSAAQPQSFPSNAQAQPSTSVTQSRTIILLVGVVGLTVLLLISLRLRKPSLTN